MDANFWANVFANILAGFNVLLSGNVSSHLTDTMAAVTSSPTFVLDQKHFLPFFRQVFFLALILASVATLWGLLSGMFRRDPRAIRNALFNFPATYGIGAFGLTIVSALASVADAYSQGVTELAKQATGARGNWYDTIIKVQNAADPASAGLAYAFSRIGAWILANQMTFIAIGGGVVVLFAMLAFVFRNGLLGNIFLRLSFASVAVVLLTKVIVSTWLAFWSFGLLYSVITGVPQLVVLGFVFWVAGCMSLILFGLFFAASKKFRAEIKQVLGGKKAREKAAQEEMETARRPSPNINPSINPSANSSASPSVREKGQQILDRGRTAYTKGRAIYDTSMEKVEKTNRIAQKVVMVSDTVGTAATFVAPKAAGVPYVGPIVAGTAVAAKVVGAAGRKVVSATNTVQHPVDYMDRRNQERSPE